MSLDKSVASNDVNAQRQSEQNKTARNKVTQFLFCTTANGIEVGV